ncbi:MAG: acetyl-CoA carboxylase biotin carboxyl carrier protein [Bacteroidota bacterium]|nr:acetyl-CoA carboxylase biotin carboxyl carrier protein [Bacteroidota bacterium]
MDIKQIQELVKLVNKSNIGELKIEKNDFKITIKQKQESSSQAAPAQFQSPQQPTSLLPPTFPPSTAEQAKGTDAVTSAKPDNTVMIKSPMIGTFYRQSGPDKPVFVSVGEEVSPGQVVCIIEAMKLFNEIESEVSGKIVKVLVEDASPVEFDQPLFLVEPS